MTLLDEIGDMLARTQAMVLRALQSGEIEPVGAGTPTTVDVRVVAATHRNLAEEIAAGRLREDLFYHLNVVPVHAPPLRERLNEVPFGGALLGAVCQGERLSVSLPHSGRPGATAGSPVVGQHVGTREPR